MNKTGNSPQTTLSGPASAWEESAWFDGSIRAKGLYTVAHFL